MALLNRHQARRWVGAWRVAIRMARREARRHWVASLLVITLVGLPVFLLVGASTVAATSDYSPSRALPFALGQAQARLVPFPARVNEQSLTDMRSRGGWGGNARWGGAVETVPGLPADQVSPEQIKALTGGRAIAIQEADQYVPSLKTRAMILHVDGADPLVGEITRLRSGRWPASDDEVVVTPRGQREGLPAAGTVVISTLEGDKGFGVWQSVRVVGTADAWDRSGNAVHAVMSAPVATITRPARMDDFDWMRRAPEYLLERTTPVPSTEVQRLNTYGFAVVSRELVSNTPGGLTANSIAPTVIGDFSLTLFTAVGIVLEVVLLVGPAFAVGAMRSRRWLAMVAVNGADQSVVRRLVLAQGLVLGVASAVVGACLGVLGAWALVGWLRDHGYWTSALALDVTPWHIVLVLITAIIAALLAALTPARALAGLDVVSALRGRVPLPPPSPTTPRRGLIVMGVALVVLALASFRRNRLSGTLFSPTEGLPLGALLLVIGALMVIPSAIVWLGARADRLPLPLRLAARDATRHRSRTAPAVAAIMATVGALVTLGMGMAASSANQAASYRASAPVGAAVVDASPPSSSLTPEQEARVASAVPGTTVVALTDPIRRRLFGSGAPYVEPTITRADCAPVQPFRARSSADCAQGTDQFPVQLDVTVVRPADVDHIVGLSPQDRTLLREGGALVAESVQPLVLDGTVRLTWTTYASNPFTSGVETVTAEGHTALRARTVAREVTDPNRGQLPWAALITSETAAAHGLATQTNRLVLLPGSAEAPFTEEQVAPLRGEGLEVRIERGYVDPGFIVTWVLMGLVGLIVLVAALSTTALSLAEQQGDLATLAAVGAKRRTRRTIAAAQAWVVATAGAVLGAALGLLPGSALAWTLASGFSGYTAGYGNYGYGGWAPLMQVETLASPLVAIPWGPMAAAVIGVPALAFALVWVSVRSDPPITRRPT